MAQMQIDFKYIPFSPNSPCKHVVLSERAYKSILAETYEHGNCETGGFLLGHFHKGIWYVIEAIDPGMSSINRASYFEFDDMYVNHLVKKLSRIYRYPLTILGMWHRHPGSMDRFSGTDLDTIQSYTSEAANGIISMLVNVDPKLRMTFYYCGKDNSIMPIRYDVGDQYIAKELNEMSDPESIYNNVGTGKEWTGVTLKTNMRSDELPKSIFIEELRNEQKEQKTQKKTKPRQKELAMKDLTVMFNFEKPAAKNLILVPKEFLALRMYRGPIYGYIRKDTGVHVVLGWKGNEPSIPLRADKIGYAGKKIRSGVYAKFRDRNVKFFYKTPWKKAIPLTIDCDSNGNSGFTLIQNVFSRQKGLLETDWMMNMTAVIAGCGSAGSAVALQLARAGVGRFVLSDTDVMDIHNICRHQCNMIDVGRYKVDALKDRILQINPNADVKAVPKLIQDSTHELQGYINKNSVIIGAGDNRMSAASCCDIATEYNIPFLSLCFWQRACVCEIFTWLPGKNHICYRCALPEAVENSMKEMDRNHFYIGEEAAEKASFEPGISIDVEFGSTIASKIILDMLNLNNPSYTSRVLHTLTQYTWICNTNNKAIGGSSATIFPQPLDIARNIVFDDRIICQHTH